MGREVRVLWMTCEFLRGFRSPQLDDMREEVELEICDERNQEFQLPLAERPENLRENTGTSPAGMSSEVRCPDPDTTTWAPASQINSAVAQRC